MDIYDRIKEMVFQKTLSSKPRVEFNLIEIGACDGDDTVKMNQILEESGLAYRQIAVEPVSSNCQVLLGKILRLSVGFLSAAVGQVDGVVDFYHSSNEKYYGSSSIRAPKDTLEIWPDMSFEKEKICCWRLDTLWKSQMCLGNDIDFIWSDIQGAEVDLILGGQETLARTRYLYTEYSDVELYEGEIKLADILAMLPGWEIVEKYDHDVLLRNTKI